MSEAKIYIIGIGSDGVGGLELGTPKIPISSEAFEVCYFRTPYSSVKISAANLDRSLCHGLHDLRKKLHHAARQLLK